MYKQPECYLSVAYMFREQLPYSSIQAYTYNLSILKCDLIVTNIDMFRVVKVNCRENKKLL